ncbi:hypothetical protein [Arthrobacter sp. Leaf234]|uniref:hypothetical protein n=1 Tax=Arthrobacter sp. Leaf234 TaxID=1736303 RepID=UPI000A661AC0|nr:hypothetical protein [Arthrobacter sp. Leaf234]
MDAVDAGEPLMDAVDAVDASADRASGRATAIEGVGVGVGSVRILPARDDASPSCR